MISQTNLLTKLHTSTPPTQPTPKVKKFRLAMHTHTRSTRRSHTLHVHQPQNRCTHTYITNHTHTPLSQASKHGALLARAAAAGADFTFHKKTHQSPISNSHTSNNSRKRTTSASYHTTAPYAAPYVVNLPVMAKWPVTAPLCPTLDMTATTMRYNSSSPSWNATTEEDGRPSLLTLVTNP
jgi:hypothetical protein